MGFIVGSLVQGKISVWWKILYICDEHYSISLDLLIKVPDILVSIQIRVLFRSCPFAWFPSPETARRLKGRELQGFVEG